MNYLQYLTSPPAPTFGAEAAQSKSRTAVTGIVLGGAVLAIFAGAYWVDQRTPVLVPASIPRRLNLP